MFRRIINVPVTVVSCPLGNCSFMVNWTLSTDGALQAKNISLLNQKENTLKLYLKHVIEGTVDD